MSATTKSGLIFAIISFVINIGVGILLAICTPLCGIVWGAGAGVLSIAWPDTRNEVGTPARSGAIAGAIAGVGAFLGVIIGMLIQFTMLGGQQLADQVSRQFSEQMGLPYSVGDSISLWQWTGFLLMGCCLGLLNLLIVAGAGAAGAHFYASTRGQSQPAI